MTANKQIAAVVDTGCDLPEAYLERADVFELPFHVIYGNEDLIANLDITTDEIIARMPADIPTTSLPSGDDITRVFDAIRARGFKQVIVINISANLSGTHNMVNLMVKDMTDLEIFTFDTKNIGIGAGFFALDVIHKIDEGASFEAICPYLESQLKKSKVFFSLDTLEYLKKGGRIGLVASLFGTALRIKPVISCNDDGIYYVVKKTRGRRQSLTQIIEQVREFSLQSDHYLSAICSAADPDEEAQVKAQMEEGLTPAKPMVDAILDPALAVHTGPGLIGVGVYHIGQIE
ncbi:DegV family protein [Peptococcus simiae]|uniref:DegV family protein n=1 Tax=Peptococcus simiae TaxID=1643805 RepID=UPI003980E272